MIWVLCSAELLSVAAIKQSLFLYRCVLNFDLTTVSLCLISPGKDLHSQLPSAKNATCDECIFPVRQGLWTNNLFLLDQQGLYGPNKQACFVISLKKEQLHPGS